ncbi:hypothetical protein BY996DRAFT_4586336, partial [Phakopsora pachyrhizi]
GCLSDQDSLNRAISSLIQSYFFINHIKRMTSLLILILSQPSTPTSSILVSCYVLIFKGYEEPSFFITLRDLKFPDSIIDSQFSSNQINHTSEIESKLSDCNHVSGVISVLVGIGKRIAFLTSSVIRNDDQTQSDQALSNEEDSLILESFATGKLGLILGNLLYELCRVQKLETELLRLFDKDMINNLFELVELTRDHQDETFNYTLIKLIIALNEQFMIAGLLQMKISSRQRNSHPSLPPSNHRTNEVLSSQAFPNIVIETMKHRLGETKTFGENLIFILNRASHSSPEGLCVSLLILKILYLLFTTTGTHEYFYTNDLCVLVDVFIRELSDLPDDCEDLLHTYLRVLHPLLTSTQLRTFFYKRKEIRHSLLSLIKFEHLRELNPTTKRLVERNLKADWCIELERSNENIQESGLGGVNWMKTRSMSSETFTSQNSNAGSMPDVVNSTTGPKPASNFTQSKLSNDSTLSLQTTRASSDPLKTNPMGHQALSPLSSTFTLSAESIESSKVRVQVASVTDKLEKEFDINQEDFREVDSLEGLISHITRPTSPLSSAEDPAPPPMECSLRPGSSSSASNIPTRRPAPKPPAVTKKPSTFLRNNTDRPQSATDALRSEHCLVSIISKQTNCEKTQEAGLPTVTITDPQIRSTENNLEKVGERILRRVAPSPPASLPSISNQPYNNNNTNYSMGEEIPRRRKAPLPPTQYGQLGKLKEPQRSLRSTKSSIQLSDTKHKIRDFNISAGIGNEQLKVTDGEVGKTNNGSGRRYSHHSRVISLSSKDSGNDFDPFSEDFKI